MAVSEVVPRGSCANGSACQFDPLLEVFLYLLIFAVSVRWTESRGDMQTETWLENVHRESSESVEDTILCRSLVHILKRVHMQSVQEGCVFDQCVLAPPRKI